MDWEMDTLEDLLPDAELTRPKVGTAGMKT